MIVAIDGGANSGQSIPTLVNTYQASWVFAYEPNPRFMNGLASIPKTTTTCAALLDYTGSVSFKISGGDGFGSSCYMDKYAIDGAVVEVPCIDISNVILGHLWFGYSVILKLDVEGAEYRIIPKLFRDGLLGQIDLILVEWHWNKIGLPEWAHEEVRAMLDKSGVSWEVWNE